MRTLAWQRRPDSARRAGANAATSTSSVLAQRKSTFGPAGSTAGSIAAPAVVDAGRPLDVATRGGMEAIFGRDFTNIRVHDDARAHDDARSLGARAYAAGDHLVFAEGAFRPETLAGRALIAHELAHSVQQGGVQMKTDGPLPAAADAELEAQADRAALDATSGRPVAGLSTFGRPAIFRAIGDPPAGGSATPAAAGMPQRLPVGMTPIKDDPPGIGSTELVVGVDSFSLPLEKGIGPWVQAAHDQAAAGGRLVFSPLITGSKVAAFKEGGEDYKSIWLGKFGFKTTGGVARAFQHAAKDNQEVKTALTDKGVRGLVLGLSSSLRSSGCDIDHIVEKQMGGTSIPSNLQLLVSKKNQASGRETYRSLVTLVESIREPGMRGPGIRKLQLVLRSATVPAGTADPSFVVEDLLRRGAVKGSDAVKAKAEGQLVALTAGGVGEAVRVTDTGRTPIDRMAKRIIPGMRLTAYIRGPRGPKGKIDKLEGELDSRAISRTGARDGVISLTAELAPATTSADADGAPADGAAVSETRVLKLAKPGYRGIAFFYPYLSPGRLTSLALDDQGNLTGEGEIKPSIPFLPTIKVRYGPDLLEAVAPLGVDKLKSPIPGFRFTEGEIGVSLSPSFIPKGTLKFEIGPTNKPVILGDLTARYESGAFIATGVLTPGAKLPGISAAEGKVEYHSERGWSGKLTAKSCSIPKSTPTAELGFTSDKGSFRAYGTGGITTSVRNSELFLKIGWHGGAVSYYGRVTVLKPLPLVDEVRLEGGYANGVLRLTGNAAITWKSISATMTVRYRRRDGDDDGKFSGRATVGVKTDKASGSIGLGFNEAGHYWGKGTISYQVTKDIRPKLDVELTRDRRVKVLGEVRVSDIVLTRMWPSRGGGRLTFIKGAGVKFNILTPVPAVTAYGEIKVSAGLKYGVGPVMLRGLTFDGELYPLEDDPKVKATLKGKLAVPAFGEIYGTFGAYIGLDVALGAVGAKGGIEVTPALRIEGEGGIDFDAAYEALGFSFSAEAYAKGRMIAKLSVDLMAELYAAWGVYSHVWTYNVKRLEKQIGPELKLTLGKIGYAKNGEITWPSASQISLEPANLDPLELVKDLMRKGKATET